MDDVILKKRQTQVLFDKKWKKFLRRTWLFRWIPFVEFALAAGSMALGNVKESSDFDVIVGAGQGRIFTARFFSVLVFGLFGWRRKKISHDEAAADKICLNHFVTEKSYRLSPPHNPYWKTLYQNLVPLWGDRAGVEKFLAANSQWTGSTVLVREDLRQSFRPAVFSKTGLEKLLSGKFGDRLENILKKIQVARIEKGLHSDLPGHKPRLIYTDEELEFHPDTRRIEEWG